SAPRRACPGPSRASYLRARTPPAGPPRCARPGSSRAPGRTRPPAPGPHDSRRRSQITGDEHERVVGLGTPRREETIGELLRRFAVGEVFEGEIAPNTVGREDQRVTPRHRDDRGYERGQVRGDDAAPQQERLTARGPRGLARAEAALAGAAAAP